MAQHSMFPELWTYLNTRRKWALLPIIAVMVIGGTFLERCGRRFRTR